MNNTELTREQWIKSVHEGLCSDLTKPDEQLTGQERANLLEWAEGMAETYYDDPDWKMEPREAIQEEYQAGA